MIEKFYKKKQNKLYYKIVQHCIKTNVQLVWPYPSPRMAYNLKRGVSPCSAT